MPNLHPRFPVRHYLDTPHPDEATLRLNIHFIDRIGIFQEMLLVFAERCLNVAVVEVDSPNIYIDVPDLTRDRFPAVREALAQVSGVQDIVDVDMLPGMRRRLYLNALLAAIADPALAVDAGGAIIVANAAATHVERGASTSIRGAQSTVLPPRPCKRSTDSPRPASS